MRAAYARNLLGATHAQSRKVASLRWLHTKGHTWHTHWPVLQEPNGDVTIRLVPMHSVFVKLRLELGYSREVGTGVRQVAGNPWRDCNAADGEPLVGPGHLMDGKP